MTFLVAKLFLVGYNSNLVLNGDRILVWLRVVQVTLSVYPIQLPIWLPNFLHPSERFDRCLQNVPVACKSMIDDSQTLRARTICNILFRSARMVYPTFSIAFLHKHASDLPQVGKWPTWERVPNFRKLSQSFKPIFRRAYIYMYWAVPLKTIISMAPPLRQLHIPDFSPSLTFPGISILMRTTYVQNGRMGIHPLRLHRESKEPATLIKYFTLCVPNVPLPTTREIQDLSRLLPSGVWHRWDHRWRRPEARVCHRRVDRCYARRCPLVFVKQPDWRVQLGTSNTWESNEYVGPHTYV